MADRVSLLLKVLHVELEEAESDVMALLEYSCDRFKNREITNYVWRENQALLKKELACVKELQKDLEKWEAPENRPIGEVIEQLTKYLKDIIRERDYPGLVSIVVERKLEKVARYLE